MRLMMVSVMHYSVDAGRLYLVAGLILGCIRRRHNKAFRAALRVARVVGSQKGLTTAINSPNERHTLPIRPRPQRPAVLRGEPGRAPLLRRKSNSVLHGFRMFGQDDSNALWIKFSTDSVCCDNLALNLVRHEPDVGFEATRNWVRYATPTIGVISHWPGQILIRGNRFVVAHDLCLFLSFWRMLWRMNSQAAVLQ